MGDWPLFHGQDQKKYPALVLVSMQVDKEQMSAGCGYSIRAHAVICIIHSQLWGIEREAKAGKIQTHLS